MKVSLLDASSSDWAATFGNLHPGTGISAVSISDEISPPFVASGWQGTFRPLIDVAIELLGMPRVRPAAALYLTTVPATALTTRADYWWRSRPDVISGRTTHAASAVSDGMVHHVALTSLESEEEVVEAVLRPFPEVFQGGLVLPSANFRAETFLTEIADAVAAGSSEFLLRDLFPALVHAAEPSGSLVLRSWIDYAASIDIVGPTSQLTSVKVD